MPTVPTSPTEETLRRATEVVRTRFDAVPRVALILGSGLGELANDVERPMAIPAAEVPGYPVSTVDGHDGQLVFGTLEGVDVVFVQGRVHYYEGYPIQRVAFPVRLVHALGAERLLVTNSAGGIHRALLPGTLMFITGHVNGVNASPLTGCASLRALSSNGNSGAQEPYYDPVWTDRAEQVARAQGIATRRGVYGWAQGPSYETPAEIRAFARMGADAIGMSTVPEVIQARHLGLRVLGLSTITNPAAGLGAEPLDHEDVLAVGRRMRAALARLVRGILRETV